MSGDSTGDSRNSVASQVRLDLELLTGLLQNPVLRGILQLEDSLLELNQHLTHHPSLLPTDFDIDSSGQLVLNPDAVPFGQSNGASKESSKLSSTLTSSPEILKKDHAPKLAVHQSFQLALAQNKREIISIQVMHQFKNTYSTTINFHAHYNG